jgi:hypothetical protein
VPANQVGEFVNRLIHDRTHYRGPERRRCPRYPLVESVSAIPLDDQLQPTGPPFDAVTRNVSACGVSIISHTRCEKKYLSLLLVNSSSDYLEVVIRVVRFRAVGPMYEYAGPFITVPGRLKQESRTQAPNLEPLADETDRQSLSPTELEQTRDRGHVSKSRNVKRRRIEIQ